MLEDEVTEHQHRQTDRGGVTRQEETHTVEITESNSLLARSNPARAYGVNSLHHQGIKKVGGGLRVVARSEDGVVEGLESEQEHPFLLAVQWHPEELVHRPD